MTSAEIQRLASDCGIATQFEDARGNVVIVDEEVLRALLINMGVLRDDGEAALVERRSERLPPALVVRGENGRVGIDLPFVGAAGKMAWQLDLEDGQHRRGETELTLANGGSRRQLVLSNIPIGYHELLLVSHDARTTLIVTPGRCWLPEMMATGGRCFGIALQLYLLKSSRNWGIGDFGDLARYGGLAGRHGCDVVGLNPLHQMFLDDPEHASPYSPASRRFLNVLYIEVEAIPEAQAAGKARALLDSAAFQQSLQRCRAARHVDYAGISRLKLDVLRLIHADYRSHAGSERKGAFGTFIKQGGMSLRNASLFQVLRDHYATRDPARAAWQRWLAELRSPGSPEAVQFARDHADEVEFYSWLQWIADQQLAEAGAAVRRAGMRIGLYRDLAVGCDRTGSETWASPSDYIGETEVGAPPDVFNPAGQNWGLPPFNPLALVREGYRPFIELVRANMRHAGGLRIDHVMGLQRLYCIPHGLPPSKGAYVSYPIDDLIGIVALESHRQQCLVVGEDLGTVPAGFRDRMAEANILSYRVLFFEHDDDGKYRPPQHYPRLAVAVAGNHDMATLRGWLDGADIGLKDRLGLYPSAEETATQIASRDTQRAEVLRLLGLDAVRPLSAEVFSEAVHRFLGRTASVLALTQLDDLLNEPDQVNVPATSTEHPNWRRRYAVPIESLTDDHSSWRLLAVLGAGRSLRSGERGEPTISAEHNV